MLDAHIHLPAHLQAIIHWVRCVRVYSSDISIRRASDVYHTLDLARAEHSHAIELSATDRYMQHIYFVRRSDVIVTSMPLRTHIPADTQTQSQTRPPLIRPRNTRKNVIKYIE